MVSRDLNFVVVQLEKRVGFLEKYIEKIGHSKNCGDEDWDDKTLQREWKISKRTAVNYRKMGLQYYKLGGRIYFTKKHRDDFLNKKRNAIQNSCNTDSDYSGCFKKQKSS